MRYFNSVSNCALKQRLEFRCRKTLKGEFFVRIYRHKFGEFGMMLLVNCLSIEDRLRMSKLEAVKIPNISSICLLLRYVK